MKSLLARNALVVKSHHTICFSDLVRNTRVMNYGLKFSNGTQPKFKSSKPEMKMIKKKDEKSNKTNSNTATTLEVNRNDRKFTFTAEQKSKYFQQIIFPLRQALKRKNIEECLYYFREEAPKYLVNIPLPETNELIYLLASVGDLKTALQLYNQMFEKFTTVGGTKPSIQTIESLFYAAKQNRTMSTVVLLKNLEIILLDDMETLELEVSNRVLHDLLFIIVHGIKNCEYESEYNELMQFLRGTEGQASPTELNADKILEIYDKTKNKNKFIHTLMVQYLDLIGKVEHIFVIYDKLKEEGRKDTLDATFYNTIITSIITHKFSKYEDVLFVLEVYREMIEGGECQPTCHTFNILLSGLKLANERDLFKNRIEFKEKVYGLYKEINYRMSPIDIDPPLLNLMSQLLSYTGKLEEARNLINSQPLNITPLTIQFLIRKSIISECETLNDFKTKIQPLFALLLDKVYEMRPTLLNFLVLRMLETNKSQKLIETLCLYCYQHFKVRVTIDLKEVDRKRFEFVKHLKEIN